MNYKKLFFGLTAVALIATMFVGFTACGEDKDEPDVINNNVLIFKWQSIKHTMDANYYLEFRQGNTYVYIDSDRMFTGDYKIFESQRVKYSDGFGNEHDAILFKMLVMGSGDFDQWWVYYYGEGIVVDLYTNNEFAQNLDIFIRSQFL